MMNSNDPELNEKLREVFHRTEILRKPLCGIVSGYHSLPYILISPADDNPSHTVEVNGKINVSPKFVISTSALHETFGEVFDPETFDDTIEGRVFSFGFSGKKNLKVESEYFRIKVYEESPEEHLNRVEDSLARQEDTRTGLISSPNFNYYPVSIDRFISEILDREFRI
ncbi:hypothetical protein QA601_05575 [Chitinispirillales bacterium ANBcel5]|uniref:hypothetical protein n=1 Tax=Cellulosispirillum alkaliphilum TaxID=3039283 RepID=UPI002A57C002|nr:hypothetical protein [Chitinispirillales bacterium ANBcel5]